MTPVAPGASWEPVLVGPASIAAFSRETANVRELVDILRSETCGALTTLDDGHSIGASCAEIVGAARKLPVVALSGPGPGRSELTSAAWDRLDGPLLVIAGEDDPGPERQSTGRRHAAYYSSPPGDKYLLSVPGIGHGLGGVAAGGAFDLRALRVVLDATRRFWEAYLLGRPVARDLLRSTVTHWR